MPIKKPRGKELKMTVKTVYRKEIYDEDMFQTAKQCGPNCLGNDRFAEQCKIYILHGFHNMGAKLAKDQIQLEFYEPENVIVGLVPDGLFSTFGKTGRSVSMRRINIICIEKSLLSGDQVKWIEHEIGHIISWRDYRDKPKVNSPFITGGESNPFRPEDVFGHNLYPNDWSEYIPFTRQMKALLNEYSPEKIIRMIMEDYEERPNSKEDLKKYEQTFINYMKCVLGKDINLKIR